MVHAGGTSSSEEADGERDGMTNWMQLLTGCMFVLFQVPCILMLFFLFSICLQVLCSVCAGVYNEYLIKGEGADIHIMIQNVFMYLDSILCNVILLGVKVIMLCIDREILDLSGRSCQCFLFIIIGIH